MQNIATPTYVEKPKRSRQRKRRNTFSITAEMLRVAKKPTKKTRIMCKVNISFQQLKANINELLKAELIKEKATYFQTTEKGIHFVQLYDELKSMLRAYSNDR